MIMVTPTPSKLTPRAAESTFMQPRRVVVLGVCDAIKTMNIIKLISSFLSAQVT